jgi:two-component system chemotaxis response regulator CheB
MREPVLPPVSRKSSTPIKVLIVDDSAFMRFTITQQLSEHPEIVVVGAASNGREALKQIPALQPDVITLDVEMPHMDGLTTLRQIMTDFPHPVIMFSSLTKEGAAETIQALMLGAVDFIPKPANRTDIRAVMDDMTAKIIHAARAKVQCISPSLPVYPVLKQDLPVKKLRGYERKMPVILIGSSTGGPSALSEVIPAFPEDLPCPVLVVQHMPAGFTHSLAERLNSISHLSVKEAVPGDLLMAGQVLLAPGGFHMLVDEHERIALNQNPTVHGVRPAVDVTLLSLIQRFGKNIIAVIMTGMGSDGTHGASVLHSDGGYVIAEHESTCVVWGMPRSVAEAGAADVVLPRPQIATAIEQEIRRLVSRFDSPGKET